MKAADTNLGHGEAGMKIRRPVAAEAPLDGHIRGPGNMAWFEALSSSPASSACVQAQSIFISSVNTFSSALRAS